MAGAGTWWTRAQEEILSARTLKKSGHAKQAYHHAGQAVEFALKAIHMKRRNLQNWPENCRGPEWHDLPRIAEKAGMRGDIEQLQRRDRVVYANWLVARQWRSNGRFPDETPSNRELNDLFLAICHDRDGIMVWLESIYQNA